MHLIAVQPRMAVDDYRSAEAFRAKLDRLYSKIVHARTSAADADSALVVFPEVIGSYLMLAGQDVPDDASLDGAIARIALARFRQVLGTAFARRIVSPSAAVLSTLSGDAGAVYVDAFSELASRLGAHVVAGSCIVPDEASGRPYNTSFHFDPTGRVIARTRKVNLVPVIETGIGLKPGRAEDIPIVDTGAAKVATLICYDGYSEPHTQKEPDWVHVAPLVATRGAQILAQPASGPWPWDAPWAYNEPGEALMRPQQWRQEGLHGQLPRLEGVRFTISAQLLGNVLGMAFEGKSEILERTAAGEVRVLAEAPSATEECVLCVSAAP